MGKKYYITLNFIRICAREQVQHEGSLSLHFQTLRVYMHLFSDLAYRGLHN